MLELVKQNLEEAKAIQRKIGSMGTFLCFCCRGEKSNEGAIVQNKTRLCEDCYLSWADLRLYKGLKLSFEDMIPVQSLPLA